MLLIRLSLIFYLLLIFSSCKKEASDFINITFTPSERNETKDIGEIIRYEITLSSNSELSEFRIIEIKDDLIIDTITIKQISGLEEKVGHVYTCPDEPSKVQLIFNCSNANGLTNERAINFNVVSEDVILSETTGHTMFSNNSSEFNSYNLLTGTPAYNSDTTTHISDNTYSISDILSKEWVSMSGLSFSKHNDFDYANATLEGVTNAYNTSVKKEFVDQISVSDIIITKIENRYVIIKVINVEDDPNGSENDRYIFNIKK